MDLLLFGILDLVFKGQLLTTLAPLGKITPIITGLVLFGIIITLILVPFMALYRIMGRIPLVGKVIGKITSK